MKSKVNVTSMPIFITEGTIVIHGNFLPEKENEFGAHMYKDNIVFPALSLKKEDKEHGMPKHNLCINNVLLHIKSNTTFYSICKKHTCHSSQD